MAKSKDKKQGKKDDVEITGDTIIITPSEDPKTGEEKKFQSKKEEKGQAFSL